ncbi:hypothetical protein L1987_08142 [Smallanthus sonchifolius]|uniref:Uncharacterized protein n=1 Tax=Smallanthus sonchifolius TaxID=185202 RepID=A0ACB9JK82_9ASTR|nr:hypothetical protein L1987_08142 [Smallanthus sonchifolius]
MIVFEFGNHSSPTASFSSNGSSISQQDSHSFAYAVTYDHDDLEYRLRELEKVMLGTDQDFMESFDVSCSWDVINRTASHPAESGPITDIISRGDFKELLIACAKSVAENDAITANWLISELRVMVSVSGEPAHRLGAYMLEGLVARLSSSGSSIYNSLKCKEPSGDELFCYTRLLYEACPYFKFGYLSANGAIAEAMKNENKIHIIDFQIALGSQWESKLLKIIVNIVGQRLIDLAQSCNIPFEFHGVSVSGSEVESKHLGVRPGESLAVNFAFMLHHMPDESVNPQNHRDRLLRLVKSLSPKVVTLVEQESNVNTPPSFTGFKKH